MNLTLRIKKKFFDAILINEKRFEYRTCKPFYDKLFANKKKYSHLTLHYQSGRKLICKIIYIRKVRTPNFVNRSIITSDYCYRIKITDPKIIS